MCDAFLQFFPGLWDINNFIIRNAHKALCYVHCINGSRYF